MDAKGGEEVGESSITRSSIKDFDVISRLGSGSFGTVFKVRRRIDSVLYVLKSVRIVELSFKEQSEAINEVTILAQMDSDYVVKYYDSFIGSDCLYIVMEYCNKGDLQNLIKKAKERSLSSFNSNVAWNISLQVILGLHYLHKKKILHRDLKSANVFLMKHNDSTNPYFQVKIGDLGVAKLLETSTAFAQTIVGTPYYLSPELCSDQPYRDKSDCWALGVLVYECCTFKHPFEARNQCALIWKIIEGQFKPPSPSTTSPEMSNLILWLLQKDPKNRPTIKELLCEDVVREKLIEHGIDIPEDILECPVTYNIKRHYIESPENISDATYSSNSEDIYSSSDKLESKRYDSGEQLQSKYGNSYDNSMAKSLAATSMVGKNDITINNAQITNRLSDEDMIVTKVINPAVGTFGLPTKRSNNNQQQIKANNKANSVTTNVIRGDRVRGLQSKRIISETALNRYQVKVSATTSAIKKPKTPFISTDGTGESNQCATKGEDNTLSCNNYSDEKHTISAAEFDKENGDSIDNLDNFAQAKDVQSEEKSVNNSESYEEYEDDFEEYTEDSSIPGSVNKNQIDITTDNKNGDEVDDDTELWNTIISGTEQGDSYDVPDGYLDEIDGVSDDDNNNFNDNELFLSSDDDELHHLYALISDAHGRALHSLGKELFQRVYELCEKHMVQQIDDNNDNNLFLEELEQILCARNEDDVADEQTNLTSACEAVFSVKVLLALEFKLKKLEQDNEIKSHK